MRRSRREFLLTGTLLVGGVAAAQKKAKPKVESGEEDVTPTEDLMREHGVLNRLLLVYEELLRQFAAPPGLQRADVLAAAAGLIKRFVEEYHEKTEEEELFPRFEKAGKQVELVAVLRQQHAAGRRLTATILGDGASKQPDAQRRVAEAMRQFIRMYRPHEAREDTVLFPGFRPLVSGAEYRRLRDAFEAREHALFGEGGFEKIVAEVGALELKLGIYDLKQFTPA